MEAIEELSRLSDSLRQAMALLADEDVDENSSTFLNIVGLKNVGRTDENLPTFHAEYINLWNNRHHDKSYLLVEEARGRQRHTRRPRRALRHPRFEAATEIGGSSSQPLVPRIEDILRQPRSTPQSTTDEGKEDERSRPQPVPERRRNNEDDKADI
ncbi:hypothetical protein Gotri_001314 [Gossypium trilobum]|uniref:Uncharacterized protein n=1 Tax=Gossypium trilobum TaxID=34281 RepID=A0A7J9FF76_9ROSI|nr:hypothetical protein [Gossypium trilobum]